MAAGGNARQHQNQLNVRLRVDAASRRGANPLTYAIPNPRHRLERGLSARRGPPTRRKLVMNLSRVILWMLLVTSLMAGQRIALAEVSTVTVARQYGIGYLALMIMERDK